MGLKLTKKSKPFKIPPGEIANREKAREGELLVTNSEVAEVARLIGNRKTTAIDSAKKYGVSASVMRSYLNCYRKNGKVTRELLKELAFKPLHTTHEAKCFVEAYKNAGTRPAIEPLARETDTSYAMFRKYSIAYALYGEINLETLQKARYLVEIRKVSYHAMMANPAKYSPLGIIQKADPVSHRTSEGKNPHASRADSWNAAIFGKPLPAKEVR